jgi:hypothetical protein
VAWNWLLSFMVSWAKPWKSRSWMQRAISLMRAGTTDSARNCKGMAVCQGDPGTLTAAWLLSQRLCGALGSASRCEHRWLGKRMRAELDRWLQVQGPPGLPLPGTGLTLSRALVSTLVCMPTVLPVSFFSALTLTQDSARPRLQGSPIQPPVLTLGLALSWSRQLGEESWSLTWGAPGQSRVEV